MTALAKLFRTTAFKIVAAYLSDLRAVRRRRGRLSSPGTRNSSSISQITETVDAEVAGLAEQYRDRRHPAAGRTHRAAGARSRASNLYLVTTYSGDALAGNIDRYARQRPATTQGWSEITYRHSEAGNAAKASRALVHVFSLPGGFRLLVGRDFEERDRLRANPRAARALGGRADRRHGHRRRHRSSPAAC